MTWRTDGSVLNQASWRADKVWLSNLGLGWGEGGINSSPKNFGCSGILHKAQRVMGCYTRLRAFWSATQVSACYGVLHKAQRILECYTRLSVLWYVIQGSVCYGMLHKSQRIMNATQGSACYVMLRYTRLRMLWNVTQI